MTLTREQIELAQQCLAFSQRAYREKTDCDAATSTEFLVWSLNGDLRELVVAFRGSQEPKDYIYDAKFTRKLWWNEVCDDSAAAAALVHRGFMQGFIGVREKIVPLLGKAERIICTGHSLGGARAMLCAAHLDEIGLPVTDVITFGAPRVGNAAFRDYYNEELHDDTLRFEAQGDPVPWMPLLVSGYRHPGREVYLTNDGHATVDAPLVSHAPAFVNTLLPQSVNLPAHFLGVFKPHYLENYQRLLTQLA